MKWQEVREQYPDTWILVEALQAHTDNERRIVEQWSIIDSFPEYYPAFQSYEKLHQQEPHREIYVTHTVNKDVTIKVRHWIGVRGIQ